MEEIMGTKFCNLNIRSYDFENIESVVSQFGVFQCTSGWITVVSEAFQWGKTQKYAKEISLSFGVPVLSTEYFDDDYVEFSLYDCGKLVTRHVPASYEYLPKKKGNVSKFIETLRINKMDESLLKNVLSITDCAQSVYLIESLLGCPIFGVKEDSPPINMPDRAVVDSFFGRDPDMCIVIHKNAAKNACPPYVTGLEKHLADQDFILSTILCFTDNPELITKKVKMWLKRIRKDREQGFFYGDLPRPDPLKEFDVRIFCGNLVVAVQGMSFESHDVAELSREFKCLVAVCLLKANGLSRDFSCSFGYGNKQICYGQRGTNIKGAKVMPNMELRSTFLNIAPGELIGAFETPDFEEAVTAMEKLFGAPLRPFYPKNFLLNWEGDHMRVYAVIND